MTDNRPDQRGFDAHLAARVSRLYYLDGMSKVDIATALQLSRFKVARLIDQAYDHGIVHIQVDDPAGEHAFAARLREHFGVEHAVIAPTSADSDHTLAELGAQTARLIADWLSPGHVLGLGWGNSVAAVVAALPRRAHPGPVDVVQLAGGFPSVDPAFNGTGLALAAAGALHGEPHLLHAPAVLESAEAWQLLQQEPAIAETAKTYDRVHVAAAGIGALRPSPVSAIYRGRVLGDHAVERLQEAGAVGDACCKFIDADGRTIPEFSERTSGMSLAQLHAVPLRVGIAVGRPKLLAIRAAMRSGLINALATDTETAAGLLAT